MERGSDLSAAVIVGINSSDSLVTVQNKGYARNGVCDEPTWLTIVGRIEDAIDAAGGPARAHVLRLRASSRRALRSSTFSFMIGCGMLGISLVDDADYLTVSGMAYAWAAMSLAFYILSFGAIGKASGAWLKETAVAISNLSPPLASGLPGLGFRVEEVKDKSFPITVTRVQGSAASQGQPVPGSQPVHAPPSQRPAGVAYSATQAYPGSSPYAQAPAAVPYPAPQAYPSSGAYVQSQPPAAYYKADLPDEDGVPGHGIGQAPLAPGQYPEPYEQQPYEQQQLPYHQQPYEQQQPPYHQQQQPYEQQPPYQQQQPLPY